MANDPWADLVVTVPKDRKPEDLGGTIIEPPSRPVDIPQEDDNG